MKVLWFSNCVLSETISNGSGTWLFGMKSIISPEVELYNITTSNVKEIVNRETEDIKEYILPDYKLYKGVPSDDNIAEIQKIVKEVSPDIIHIWGIEKYWARLFQRGYLKGYPVLLEIQGVLSACGNCFYGGLTPKEIFSTFGIREVLRPWARLDNKYKRMRDRAFDETMLIKSFPHLSTQSAWTRHQLYFSKASDGRVYETLRPLRKEFYKAEKWGKKDNTAPIVYTSASYNSPFKGLHVLIKTMQYVVKKYPKAKLKIAGSSGNKPFYKEDGYIRYIKRLIKGLGIKDNVEFVGRLDANGIISNLHNCDVFVNPSFVESYSAAAAEALYLGVPSVLSYAGAMPYFSEEKTVALYYSPMDFVDCAAKIIDLFEDEVVRNTIIHKAVAQMPLKCSPEKVRETQLLIYKEVLNNC